MLQARMIFAFLLVIGWLAISSVCMAGASKTLLSWDDLVSGESVEFKPTPGKRFEVDLSNDRYQQLPLEIRQNPELARIALSHFMVNPKPLDGGVFGKVGQTNLYVGLRHKIPDYSRLYWVMVRVLSKHYGCFMKSRYISGDYMGARCRDGRLVVFRRSKNQSLIQFLVKQFDKQGRELIVRGHRIIKRISGNSSTSAW